jgi:hypothetical protein
MLAALVQISTSSHDSGIGIICYVHSLIGLKDIHVSKKDMDDQFCDVFNSDQALTPKSGDLNRLRNEACYLMMNIHQKYLSL